MWGLRSRVVKARKCPIETVSVCLKKYDVGKLILYDTDVEKAEAKQFGDLLVIVTFVMYHFL